MQLKLHQHFMELPRPTDPAKYDARTVTLFVCGDVMTGRGIDQILPKPSEPQLFEQSVSSAVEYVKLAESVAGPIPRPVSFDYMWGDALGELERVRPDVRIVNLETAVTVSSEPCPDKGIHYRMHPANVQCLTVAGIDCCVLANNHVLDWGRSGLEETLKTLHVAGIRTAGAGSDEVAAASPAVIDVPGGSRVLVFGFAMTSSGVPRKWRATRNRPGVNWLEESAGAVEAIGRQISRHRLGGDIVIASIHWGGNWGYRISSHERDFAHHLVDTAGVDLIHGHSSHHIKGIEVHRRKTILYGCGDFLNDYEGIGGYESYRPELALMYFPMLAAGSGDLVSLTMVPVRRRRFQTRKASGDDLTWLAATMDRECSTVGSRVTQRGDGTLALQWDS